MLSQFALTFLLVGALVVVAWTALIVGARRFARRRRREGAWDASGPLHPSEPPPGWGSIPGYVPPRPTIEHEDPGEQ